MRVLGGDLAGGAFLMDEALEALGAMLFRDVFCGRWADSSAASLSPPAYSVGLARHEGKRKELWCLMSVRMRVSMPVSLFAVFACTFGGGVSLVLDDLGGADWGTVLLAGVDLADVLGVFGGEAGVGGGFVVLRLVPCRVGGCKCERLTLGMHARR